jgi:acyl dehydratase
MEIASLAELKKLQGSPLPPSEWMTVTQDMINSFADATRDFQWIHTDPERARNESPFKTPIAHGFMSVALLSALIEEVVKVKSASMGVNYGLNKVRFPQPVPVNSQLRLLSSILSIEDAGRGGAKITWACTVEIKGAAKPACVAEWITLLYE